MQTVTESIPQENATILLREIARRHGLGERTMKKRLLEKRCPVLAVAPRRLVVRSRDYAAYLKACEL